MTAHVQNRQDGQAVEAYLARIARAVEHTLAAEGSPELDVSVTLVSDPELHELNRTYLAHDYPTDVVTFPLREPGDPDPLLGEVVISADRAREEADGRGIPFVEELCRYAVHGALHLVGYDDQAPDDHTAMHARQEELLRELAEREGSAES